MTISCEDCPLRKREVFTDLTDTELTFMGDFKLGELQIDAGAPIMLEGSNSPHFHTVLSGAGLRSKSLPDGRIQVVNFIFPGDLVGLQASMFGEMDHSAEAVTPMVLCVFSRDRLWEIYRDHAARAYDVTWLAASEERSMAEFLLSVGQRNALERTAALLCYMIERARTSGLAKTATSMPFPFRQQQLADALGLSLVHTNKMLKTLRKRGLIALSGGKFVASDLDGLRELAMLEADYADRKRALL